jgi:hypothetical protein
MTTHERNRWEILTKILPRKLRILFFFSSKYVKSGTVCVFLENLSMACRAFSEWSSLAESRDCVWYLLVCEATGGGRPPPRRRPWGGGWPAGDIWTFGSRPPPSARTTAPPGRWLQAATQPLSPWRIKRDQNVIFCSPGWSDTKYNTHDLNIKN